MRLDVKTVKGNDYVQLVDDNGYIHHIGPVNPTNIGAAIYTISKNEFTKWNEWINKYCKSINADVESEKIEMGLQGLYLNGSDVFGRPRSTVFATSSELEEIHKNLFNRVKMFDLVHNHWKEEYERRGSPKSKTSLRQLVQKVYREASQEEKERWMRVMKKNNPWDFI